MARKVSSTEELEYAVDDLTEEGWNVEKKTNKRAVLKKNNFGSLAGHVLVALFTAWWTFGFGNLVYAAGSYAFRSRKRVIRVEE